MKWFLLRRNRKSDKKQPGNHCCCWSSKMDLGSGRDATPQEGQEEVGPQAQGKLCSNLAGSAKNPNRR